jgi:hypothetical protein
MSGEQLGEVEVDRLQAAVFEQRRLSHMLRQRGAEIEALSAQRERLADKERKAAEREESLRQQLRELEKQAGTSRAERDRLAVELKQARYEARRAERRVEKTQQDAAAERERADRRRQEAEDRLSSLSAERERVAMQLAEAVKLTSRLEARLEEAGRTRKGLQSSLKQAQYEARRADRRTAKLDREAGEARKRSRLQLDALVAELGQSELARDRAFAERERARVAAIETVQGLEESARSLGRAQSDNEALTAAEREREVALTDSEGVLIGVGEDLLGVRRSRSWRWGQAFSRALRTLTFRRTRTGRSALDLALGRLEAEGLADRARDERRIA